MKSAGSPASHQVFPHFTITICDLETMSDIAFEIRNCDFSNTSTSPLLSAVQECVPGARVYKHFSTRCDAIS